MGMKKLYHMAILILCCLCLAACAKNRQPDEESEYMDILSKKENFDVAEGSLHGMQFYQGEPVQILTVEQEHEANTERTVNICLRRENSEKELLVTDVPYFDATGTLFLDQEGYCYALNHDALIKFNGNGEQAYSIPMGSSRVASICQLQDGRIYLVLSVSDSERGTLTKLAELDPATGAITNLNQVELDSFSVCIGEGEDGLYLLSSSKTGSIWKINADSGVKECTLSFEGTSYTLESENKVAAFRVSGDGKAEILRKDSRQSGSSEVLQLSKVEKIPIVMRGGFFSYGWIRQQVNRFNRTNGLYYIVLEECSEEEDEEDFIMRTSVELATGKGPDILYGSFMDRYASSLIEKGVLENLLPYMEASGIKEEDYFPCTFNSWREGEKIYSILPEVSISQDIIDKEALGELAGTEELDIEGLMDALLAYKEDAVYRWNMDSLWLLERFLGGSEDIWGMVDWEEGTCDFSSGLFGKILEVSKRYGYDKRYSYPQLTRSRGDSDLFHYESREELVAQDKMVAGRLFNDGCHWELDTDFQLAMNANSTKKEGVWAFLSFLLSREAQTAVGSNRISIPTRRDVFDNFVAYNRAQLNGSGRVIVRWGTYVNGESVTLVDKTGTAADLAQDRIDEFLETLEDARPLPIRTAPILDIIYEEAEYYFSGSKTIEEVIDIISNRAQLYLSEGR